MEFSLKMTFSYLLNGIVMLWIKKKIMNTIFKNKYIPI